MNYKTLFSGIVVLASFWLQSCDCGCTDSTQSIRIHNGNLWIEVDTLMRTKITSQKQTALLNNDFNFSEYLTTRHRSIKEFRRTSDTAYAIMDMIGKGKSYVFTGLYHQGAIKVEKHLKITIYDRIPDWAIFNTYFVNKGERLGITKWFSNHYNILFSPKDTLVWSFQGGTTDERSDWIRPVSDDFYRENYLGMTSSDYGGGIPVTDIWRRDVGITIGHLNPFPLRLSLPVEADDEVTGVDISIRKKYKTAYELTKGDTLQLPQTFTAVHTGDCFSPLREYSHLMQKKGLTFPKPEANAFEPVWCAWGYGRNVTLKEIIGTLPKVKALGFNWVVIDDGYQQAEGDWHVNKSKFPGGDRQMKALVDKIHSYGLKAKIWYTPLAVAPGSKLLKNNPDVLLFNEDWSPRFITWWNSYYMGPTYSKTITLTKEALHLFFNQWGFDGVKLDGQFQNAVPPDYNPAHHLKSPEEACEKLPDFFKMIYQTIRKTKPNAVVEHCPCGTCMSYFNMQTMNQAVASDPTSSWQIRLKGKVYKALLNKTAYYGDHVELSDGGDDFASTIGIGGVPGSKFTWPQDNPNPTEGHFLLTRAKEKIWKKWIHIYHQKMLSKAKYLGTLYDIGWDKPETHVLQKGDTLFYSFYAKKWNGPIELRGLDTTKTYKIYDYVNQKNRGLIKGKKPLLEASFQNDLLIEVTPK